MSNIKDEIKDWKRKQDIIPFHIFSEADIENLLVGAIEGGSNYWYDMPDLGMIEAYMKKGEPLSTEIWRILNEHPEIQIPVYESDGVTEGEESEPLGYISKERMAEAELLMIRHKVYRFHAGHVLSECDDATTADVWFQFVVMKDVVYG